MDALTCLLMDTAKQLKSSLTKSLKPYNLTCRQAIVLRALKDGGISAKVIGEACSMDKATLSAVLDKLIEHDYISCEKNEADKRENIYSLTGKGIKILPELSQVETDCVSYLTGVLDDGEYRALYDMLVKVRESV